MLLQLGLLFESGKDETTVSESATFVSFQHKSFQEYSSSLHIKRRLEKAEDKKVTVFSQVTKFCPSGPKFSVEK